MKDQLNAEITRFADLCAKVRPDWKVKKIKGPDDEDDYLSVFAEFTRYDTYFRSGCGAMIFWLLDEFPVTFSVFLDKEQTGPRTVKAWAIVGGWRTTSPAASESDANPLHYVVLHQVLQAVNSILEAEAKSE